MASLWDALGRPPPDNPLPRATSQAWSVARRALRRALRGIGGTGAWRSPAALWAATRGGALPVGRTWGQLCEGLTLLHASTAERRGTAGVAMKAASWNVRWMLDPHTTVAAAKRAVILRLLAEGCVVLLQETTGPRPHARRGEVASRWRRCAPRPRVPARTAGSVGGGRHLGTGALPDRDAPGHLGRVLHRGRLSRAQRRGHGHVSQHVPSTKLAEQRAGRNQAMRASMHGLGGWR